uniref:Uncharacterized protein n=1 Tax=Rhizophora mucronata TaxID=61149 RepID=A0A2P2N5S5_RHIMU
MPTCQAMFFPIVGLPSDFLTALCMYNQPKNYQSLASVYSLLN